MTPPLMRGGRGGRWWREIVLSERERNGEGTRTDRPRRRPSCAVDCTTKGAIMRPFSNHRAFCPPFDLPLRFPPPCRLRSPFSPRLSQPCNQPTRFCSATRARYIARRAEGYRVFLFKCTPSTCRRAPADLNAIRECRRDLTRCRVGAAAAAAAKKSVNERLSALPRSGMKGVPGWKLGRAQ